MPLPEPPPVLTRAPVWAGVGLQFNWDRFPLPGWPQDWWQRNYDAEWDDPGPPPLTYRQRFVPDFPYPWLEEP